MKLPNSHTYWHMHTTEDGVVYQITAPHNDRSRYSLYKKTGKDDWELVTTSNNPGKFESLMV